jgi:predicted nucleotidyltransferase
MIVDIGAGLLQCVKDAKFPYWRDTIHLFVGGSALHGAKVEGYDDLDIYGVFVEPPEKIIGVDAYEHFVWSTGTNDSKNTKDDIDITLYGLKKWAQLACKGNPSILHFLFASNTVKIPNLALDTWFQAVTQYREHFVCKKHAKQFLGFGSAQLMRMTGERCRNVNRPDLVEQYGYDTKFAMHVIRLLVECEELMKTGQITLPSIEKDLLIEIRTGKHTQEWVIEEANRRFVLCKEAEQNSKLRPEIDRNFVSKVISEAYLRHWRYSG